MDDGVIILAYLSFSGSAQLFNTSIIDTPLFLKYNGDEAVLRENFNNVDGIIIRKSSTSISLHTTSNVWQITVVIY